MSRTITTITGLAGFMQLAYQKFNEHCFGGALPDAVISFEPGKKKKALGWFYTVKAWDVQGGAKYGIVIASDGLDRSMKEIYCTLIHEMCHLYAQENGIQDTSRSGSYHNKEFKRIAEDAGLDVLQMPKIGWTTPSVSYSLSVWIDENLPKVTCALVFNLPEKVKSKNPKKKSGYYKYICPLCEATARTTKEMYISCEGVTGDVHPIMQMELDIS